MWTDPPGLLFPSIPLISSIVTPLGRGWDAGGAWWGASACWEPEPLVLMADGYWIWTWGWDWPGLAPTSCWLVSTFIWGVHNRCGETGCCCRCCCCFGGEEAFLAGGELSSVVAAAAIGVVSGRGGTEGVAGTTGTIGMMVMGTWGGGRDGAGRVGGWCGCWRWPSSPQVMWLALTGWVSEATSSTRFDSASLLMSSSSLRCSSSGINKIRR